MIGLVLIILSVLILGIWIFTELKRVRHKLWAIFLIALILFGYISFTVVLKDKNIDYHSFSGLMGAGKLYLSWVGSILGNLKTITANAIRMDWGTNSSS